MSLFFGKKDQKPITDMNGQRVTNVGNPVDNEDAINKKTLEKYINEHDHVEPTYKTCFCVNIHKAVIGGTFTLHGQTRQVKMIRNGNFILHQDDQSLSPALYGDYISSETHNSPLSMVLMCPEFAHANISVFIVLKRKLKTVAGVWEYIVGNDDGSHDKFIAYKRNSTSELAYGGGYPVKEYNCTIPSRVNTLEKHLISCHWMMTNSHVRINNIIPVNSVFTTNWEHIGAPFSSVFANKRLGSAATNSLTAELYEIKIICGYMSPDNITMVSRDLMKNHAIIQAPKV